MRSSHRFIVIAAALVGLPLVFSWAAPALQVGQAAPDFSAKDSHGRVQTLRQYRGKYVVLEWFNNQCPFIRKHYDSDNMQKLQQRYTDKGVIWFSVLSSAPGTQGYADAVEANREAAANHSHATALLLDSDDTIARLYGAKNTPAMYIIGPDGRLIYQGAIDDHPTTEIRDIPKSHNYVAAALDAALAGQPVRISQTKPYGCSVKYKG